MVLKNNLTMFFARSLFKDKTLHAVFMTKTRCLFVLACLYLMNPSQAEDLAILQIVPLSGSNVLIGEDMRLGAQICFDEINANGGVNGRKLKLISVDEDVNAKPIAVQDLINRYEPIAIYGMVGTDRAEALLQSGIIDKAQIPVVGTRTGGFNLLNAQNPWVFNTRTSYADEIAAIFRQLATVGIRQIAILHPIGDHGMQMLYAARDSASPQGVQIVTAIGYLPDVAIPDDMVQDMLNVPHQAVLLTGDTASIASFIQKYRMARGTGQLIVLSSAEGTQIPKIIGAENTYGTNVSLIVPSPRNLKLPVVRDFLASWNRYGTRNAEPTTVIMESYLGAKVLVEGLRLAGTTPSRPKLAKALSGMTGYDLGGIVFSYNNNTRTASRYVDIAVLDRNGHLLR